MSADTSRDISMEEISLDTKTNLLRCSTPTQNSRTNIFIGESTEIPEVPEPEDPNEKDDTYTLLMLALRTSFVYKRRNKNRVKDGGDATAGPSNWNQNLNSFNDSSVQVHDVSSSDMSFADRHLVKKKNSTTENPGITFSVEKYFLNNVEQDTPPPNRHADDTNDADTEDADTDMEIDVMTIEKDNNVVSNKETENIANTLQNNNYRALTQTCCLCKKLRCPVRDEYLGEKSSYQSIPESSQIIPESLQPTVQEDIKNFPQAQNTLGSQYWMKYVESAPLTISRCPEGSLKDHRSNNSFGSIYPEMRGLIAPVPIRPIRPYHQLEYITSSTSTSYQQRINLLQYPGHSVTTVPPPVLSAPFGCDYWNRSLGVSHPEVPEPRINLMMYSQERLSASISQESFSELRSSAFKPYKSSEFFYSPPNNHCQQPHNHSKGLMPGVHSPLVDRISSTVNDQGSSVPDILLPVNEQCAHFCQKTSIAHCAYWCPPLTQYIP